MFRYVSVFCGFLVLSACESYFGEISFDELQRAQPGNTDDHFGGDGGDDGSFEGGDGSSSSGGDSSGAGASSAGDASSGGDELSSDQYLTGLYSNGDRSQDAYSVPGGYTTTYPALNLDLTSSLSMNSSHLSTCHVTSYELSNDTRRPSKFNGRKLLGASHSSGRVGELVIRGKEEFGLFYHEWDGSAWGDLVLVDRNYFGLYETAQLLFDSYGNPHVFVQRTNFTIRHFVLYQGSFVHLDTLSPPVSIANGDYASHMMVEIDSNDRFHVIYQQNGAQLYYGKNLSGSWDWTLVASGLDNFSDDFREFFHDDSWARSLDFALDGNQRPHIIYSANRVYEEVPGGTEIDSSLVYTYLNSEGTWSSNTLSGLVESAKGDAGQSASIAISESGNIGIAAFALDRFATGSALYGRLKFVEYDAAGNFLGIQNLEDDFGPAQSEYVAADGPTGMGASPQLSYINNSPHIVFSDHASAHLPSSESFVGNLRMAYRSSGTWQFQKIFSQSDPLNEEVYQPSFRHHGSECWISFTFRND